MSECNWRKDDDENEEIFCSLERDDKTSSNLSNSSIEQNERKFIIKVFFCFHIKEKKDVDIKCFDNHRRIRTSQFHLGAFFTI